MVDQVALNDGLGREVDQGKVDGCHYEANESSYNCYYQWIGDALCQVFDL